MYRPPIGKEIEGYDVVTVPQAGWAGIQNGELLRLAQSQFDVFVTRDRNLSFQQHLPQFSPNSSGSWRLPPKSDLGRLLASHALLLADCKRKGREAM